MNSMPYGKMTAPHDCESSRPDLAEVADEGGPEEKRHTVDEVHLTRAAYEKWRRNLNAAGIKQLLAIRVR